MPLPSVTRSARSRCWFRQRARVKISVTSEAAAGGSVNHVEFQQSGSTVAIDYGVVGDRLVLGLNDGAETALTGPSDTLADTDTYKTAMSYLPAEYQAAYFVNVAQLSADRRGSQQHDLQRAERHS